MPYVEEAWGISICSPGRGSNSHFMARQEHIGPDYHMMYQSTVQRSTAQFGKLFRQHSTTIVGYCRGPCYLCLRLSDGMNVAHDVIQHNFPDKNVPVIMYALFMSVTGGCRRGVWREIHCTLRVGLPFQAIFTGLWVPDNTLLLFTPIARNELTMESRYCGQT